MELIEDLGMLPTGNMGRKARFGLYRCPECSEIVKCDTAGIKNKGTTKCRSCSNRQIAKANALTASSNFEAKSRIVHGDLYDYHLVDYLAANIPVKIFCRKHAEFFLQRPSAHIQGHGCPKCMVSGFNINKNAILYYLRVHHDNTIAYKIGITNRTVDTRFRKHDLNKITILKQWEFYSGEAARDTEQEILKQYSAHKYLGEPLLSNGNTELFTIDILGLDNI